jgi:hypothetical protein
MGSGIMQYWINGAAIGGVDDKINPPAADHYSVSGENLEIPKNLYIFSML